MAAFIAHHDAALHRQSVEAERIKEQMQDTGVIGIPGVLHHQLPVVAEALTVLAENLDRPVEHPVDELARVRAEIGFDIRGLIGECAEDQPVVDRNAQRLQPVIFDLKGVRHAADALDSVAESHTYQFAGLIE